MKKITKKLFTNSRNAVMIGMLQKSILMCSEENKDDALFPPV